MHYYPDRPLVVQQDRTVLLEALHPLYDQVRQELQRFAELIKSPAYIHTYKLTPLSLWKAAASGWQAADILTILATYSKFPIPYDVQAWITEDVEKYGQFILIRAEDDQLFLLAKKKEELEKLLAYPSLDSFFIGELKNRNGKWQIQLAGEKRGELKQECIRIGFPIIDEAGYREGDRLEINFKGELKDGSAFQLREYQEQAVQAFYQDGSPAGGQGTIVLPCGAGKTIVGLAVMCQQQVATLILTSNTTSVKQWKKELLEKTTLLEEQVGEYTGEKKEIRPVTIATYQVLTYRQPETALFMHMDVFQGQNWGLVIYDEVHLLPAPVFRATATIQSTRRLGLTATLVREDGREGDVFSLIGPNRYELPWKYLEDDGYIAKAYCTEVRVDLSPEAKRDYYLATARTKMRIAQENRNKVPIIQALLKKHRGQPTLIIGQYIEQLERIGLEIQVPVITGKMKQKERDQLYAQFRQGEVPVLAVSKVANFAVDLPEAAVAIQISGMYGSRQEEAQRLGRILRPKQEQNDAYFYHVVTKDTVDQEYALKRRMFLVEQGYQYDVIDIPEGNEDAL